MSILVVNSGSSSLKVALFDHRSLTRTASIRIEAIGEATSKLHVNDRVTPISCTDHSMALTTVLSRLIDAGIEKSEITAVGHRVVHGGQRFVEATIIDEEVEQHIESIADLAPLHNPACLAGIRAARELLTTCPHVAIFDTAFHSTLPPRAKQYALNNDVTAEFGIQRFGFHGISHAYAAQQAVAVLAAKPSELRLISCHLGNGCSITAIENGRSVETSMGMTPLEGLVMGSRCGDLDPGIVLMLMKNGEQSVEVINTLLNRQSGLYGMTGTNDMREIEQRAGEGDESCRAAIHVFSHRARKYVGAYAAAMGGVDAIVFTGGIGENSAYIRHRIAQRFDYLGANLDEDRNRDAKITDSHSVIDISAPTSRVKLLVVAANEELAIATTVSKTLNALQPTPPRPQIPVAISARHIHLTQETVELLFGVGYELHSEHPLSQPGQYAAQETLTLIGPRNRIEGVRILGPTRKGNQIEISRSDEFFLGIDAPVRASGDTENTPGITLEGPLGTVTIKNGVICALRHIHMHSQDARLFNLQDGDLVQVEIDGENRDLTFNDVLIRVSDQFKLEMHIDTDEANAAGLVSRSMGTLVPLDDHVRLVQR